MGLIWHSFGLNGISGIWVSFGLNGVSGIWVSFGSIWSGELMMFGWMG